LQFSCLPMSSCASIQLTGRQLNCSNSLTMCSLASTISWDLCGLGHGCLHLLSLSTDFNCHQQQVLHRLRVEHRIQDRLQIQYDCCPGRLLQQKPLYRKAHDMRLIVPPAFRLGSIKVRFNPHWHIAFPSLQLVGTSVAWSWLPPPPLYFNRLGL
jgi:hypothetical protein